MKLSENTLNIMRNFSMICSNFVIKPGTSISTMSEDVSMCAKANIAEEFTSEFGIYDLKEFLSAINLVGREPEVTIEEKFARVEGNGNTLKYYFTDVDILTYPEREIKMPEPEVVVQLTAEQFANIQKAASTLSHKFICFEGKDGNLSVSVLDIENATSSVYRVDLGPLQDSKTFNFIFSIDSLKIIPGDYEISFSSKLISQFKSLERGLDLTYWISLDKASTYKG